MKKYILYGTGWEAEKFLYENKNIQEEIIYCIDSYQSGFFHGIPIQILDDNLNIKGYYIIVAAVFDTFRIIKKNLEEYNLCEFENFIWSRAFDKKVIVMNGNCYMGAVEKYLLQSNKFCKEYLIYPLPWIYLNTKKEIDECLIEHCDVYIHQDIRVENSMGYKLSDEYIVPKLKTECLNITIPNFVGMAKWLFPQQGEQYHKDTANGIGLYLSYKNYVLEEAYLSGNCSTVDEYVKYYQEKEYNEKNLQVNWEEDIKKLVLREKKWTIKVSDYIMENYQTIPCFVDKDHPSKELMCIINKQIAKLLNINDIENDSKYELSLGWPIPLLPCVKRYFQIKYIEENEKPRCVYTGEVLDTLEKYIKHYFWLFHNLDLK